MKQRLLTATTIGLMFSTGVFAQSPSEQPKTDATSAAQLRQSNLNVSATLTEKQRTRVIESLARSSARPMTSANFSLSVGALVPRDVPSQALPADVAQVMPQYRGYDFVVVGDDIAIIDPRSYRIVDVLTRAGQSTAAVPTPRKTTLSDNDREVIRKHTRSQTESGTTGSAASARIRVGDRLPASAKIRSFPDEACREAPALREYRYIERDNRTYVVAPRERTVIEEID